MDPVVQTRNYQRSASGNGSEQWATLLSRVLEDLSRIIRLELELLEARVTPSVAAMGERLIASLILVCAGAVAGCCILAALILLLHQWIPWWQAFGVGGLVTMVCGLIVYANLSRPAASAKGEDNLRAEVGVTGVAASER
jgi:hypothetical protein